MRVLIFGATIRPAKGSLCRLFRRRLFPRYILTTEDMGKAMIHVAKWNAPKPILESWDIGNCARIIGS
jgi:hypothetical protein